MTDHHQRRNDLKSGQSHNMPNWFPQVVVGILVVVLGAVFTLISIHTKMYATFPSIMLSLIGCIALLYTIFAFQRLRKTTNYFIVALGTMDICVVLSFMLSADPERPPKGGLCTFQGICITWTLLVQGFFCSSLVTYLFNSLTHSDAPITVRNLIYFNIVVVFTCLIWSTLPAFLYGENNYTSIGAHCWISQKTTNGRNETVWLFYSVIWFNICLIVLQIIRLRIHYVKAINETDRSLSTANPILAQQRKQSFRREENSVWSMSIVLNSSNRGNVSQTTLKIIRVIDILSFYPVIEVCSWIPLSVYRIFTVYINPGYSNVVLEAGCLCILLLAGFFNSVLFFLHQPNQNCWKPTFLWLYERLTCCFLKHGHGSCEATTTNGNNNNKNKNNNISNNNNNRKKDRFNSMQNHNSDENEGISVHQQYLSNASPNTLSSSEDSMDNVHLNFSIGGESTGISLNSVKPGKSRLHQEG